MYLRTPCDHLYGKTVATINFVRIVRHLRTASLLNVEDQNRQIKTLVKLEKIREDLKRRSETKNCCC